MTDRRRPSARFLARASPEVAPALLGMTLVRILPDRTRLSVRLVETEAYEQTDPASHSFRGRTERNAVMFGPAGHLYVYFTYGMHFCANAVCGEEGEGLAVLLRGLTPLSGLGDMRRYRPAARRDADLCSGPAKLCAAFGLGRAFDGADLVTGDRGVVIGDDGTPPPGRPVVTTRIGLAAGRGDEHPWRWHVAGAAGLSRPVSSG